MSDSIYRVVHLHGVAFMLELDPPVKGTRTDPPVPAEIISWDSAALDDPYEAAEWIGLGMPETYDTVQQHARLWDALLLEAAVGHAEEQELQDAYDQQYLH